MFILKISIIILAILIILTVIILAVNIAFLVTDCIRDWHEDRRERREKKRLDDFRNAYIKLLFTEITEALEAKANKQEA